KSGTASAPPDCTTSARLPKSSIEPSVTATAWLTTQGSAAAGQTSFATVADAEARRASRPSATRSPITREALLRRGQESQPASYAPFLDAAATDDQAWCRPSPGGSRTIHPRRDAPVGDYERAGD